MWNIDFVVLIDCGCQLITYATYSGGNTIGDLASVDSLNSFPKLTVRFSASTAYFLVFFSLFICAYEF